MSYLQPLSVYVVWHPQFKAGMPFAAAIYQQFCRDFEQPNSRNPGIPVFFRSLPEVGEGDDLPPIDIPLEADDCQNICVIVLLENNLIASEPWLKYLASICERIPQKVSRHRLLLVQLFPGPIDLPYGMGVRNFVLLGLQKESGADGLPINFEDRKDWLLFTIACELCRMMMRKPGEVGTLPKLNIFLSHARRDGAEDAKALNAFIGEKKNMSAFLDVLSIDYDADFRSAIEEGVHNSILLVWLTDVYSSRDWCRRELLFAKQYRRPILLVDHLQSHEARSFPYDGNVPTMRWRENAQEVLMKLALEALRHFYAERFLEQVKASAMEWARLQADTVVLPNAPELLSFNFLDRKVAVNTMLYPDPPLSKPELDILELVAPKAKFVTPAWILANPEKGDLHNWLDGKKIAVSISDPSESELLRNGFSRAHLKDTLVEFFRYILSGGGVVLYGGDLRNDGHTAALRALAREYASENMEKKPLENYLFWPTTRELDVDLKAEFIKVVRFNEFKRNALFGTDSGLDPKEFGIEDRIALAYAASEMRNQMATDEAARIVMGGKLTGYSGFFPGLLEETWNSMRLKKPVFLLGAWGGCAGAICDMLETKQIPEVFKTTPDAALTSERKKWESQLPILAALPESTEKMAQDILKWGLAGLHNGLSNVENHNLMKAVHVPEMVGLVMKGLGV
jgi:hypothetical protein